MSFPNNYDYEDSGLDLDCLAEDDGLDLEVSERMRRSFLTMTLTDNQKAVLQEHEAADRAVLDAADAEEQVALGGLLGRKIVAIRHDATSSGLYELTLDDGRIVRFDVYSPRDAPYINMSVVAE